MTSFGTFIRLYRIVVYKITIKVTCDQLFKSQKQSIQSIISRYFGLLWLILIHKVANDSFASNISLVCQFANNEMNLYNWEHSSKFSVIYSLSVYIPICKPFYLYNSTSLSANQLLKRAQIYTYIQYSIRIHVTT